MNKISERLKEALFLRNMKQSELARITGIGKSSISTYIAGEYNPKQENLIKISQALSVNIFWLMGYDVPVDRQLTGNETDLNTVLNTLNEIENNINNISKTTNSNSTSDSDAILGLKFIMTYHSIPFDYTDDVLAIAVKSQMFKDFIKNMLDLISNNPNMFL